MAYNRNVLKDLLRARSLTQAQLSERLNLGADELTRKLDQVPEPGMSTIREIAKELSVPPFVFFMEQSPNFLVSLPDFRSKKPGPVAKTRETVRAIQVAEAVQKAAAESSPAFSHPALPSLRIGRAAEIDECALLAREEFGISLQDQEGATSAGAFYTVCRKRIEDRGIFVMQESFPASDGSGFCLFDQGPPVIVVNTQGQSKGRRLFTLAHELGHILLREPGISDPSCKENQVERACNRFAAAFLAPSSYVKRLLKNVDPPFNPTPDQIARAARRLKLSQEATIVRLEQLGLYAPGTRDEWLAQFDGQPNPDWVKERGGGNGEPPPQWKVKLARYGFRFARVFEHALASQELSELGLYRISGLKPKYQREFFKQVNGLSGNDIQALELDDE